MAALDYQRTIIGYHGCDRQTAERVLLGRSRLSGSRNDYDWLGSGIYFWEYGPERALDWAREVSARQSRRIRQPAVLGAIIHLGVCFDLLDVRFTSYLGQLYPRFLMAMAARRRPVPENEPLPGQQRPMILRKLDCAVLNWVIPFAEAEQGFRFHTVRGVFQEGKAAFRGSAVKAKSHIQVAVRDPACVLGYFRPEA
jgi:hypothetical protein